MSKRVQRQSTNATCVYQNRCMIFVCCFTFCNENKNYPPIIPSFHLTKWAHATIFCFVFFNLIVSVRELVKQKQTPYYSLRAANTGTCFSVFLTEWKTMMSNSLSMELLHTWVTCQLFFPTLSVSLFVCWCGKLWDAWRRKLFRTR